MGHPDPAFREATLDRVRQLRLRGCRDRTGTHFAEGFRAFLQATEARIPVRALLYSETLCRSGGAQKQVRLAKREGVPVVRVTPEQYRSVSTTARASGIGAILAQHWTPLAAADPRRGLCWLAVSRLRSPGNLGTILRTAEAVGAGGIILLGDALDPFDPGVVRASMGGIFGLRLVRATLLEFALWARRHGCGVLGASPSGARLYTEVPVDPPLVLLLGEERLGLTPDEERLCTDLVRIPLRGRADSLNVAVAAGVLLYELLRRGQAPRAPLPEGRRSTRGGIDCSYRVR